MKSYVDKAELRTEAIFKNIPVIIQGLFECSLYPWEVLPDINQYICKLIAGSSLEGYIEYSDGVWIGKGTDIAKNAVICSPCIIGNECEIRPGAYIRGNVITGRGCVIGNSTEIKNSVIFDNVQLPHYNYVGDSVIGNHSHMGAGAVCSNQKQDKSEIAIKCLESIASGLHKLGAILSDNVEIGCGCVLNPGTVVMNNSRVYPLVPVRGVVPPDSIMKSNEIIEAINNTKLP